MYNPEKTKTRAKCDSILTQAINADKEAVLVVIMQDGSPVIMVSGSRMELAYMSVALTDFQAKLLNGQIKGEEAPSGNA